MLDLPETIILFDTEYTSWEGSKEENWSRPGEHREIVEIGAVRMNTDRFREIDSFEIFVRPALNPELSEYFMRLTGISQKNVRERGFDFPFACRAFFLWAGAYPLYSFGSDPDVMKENCRLANIPFPFDPAKFFDIRTTFKEFGIDAFHYTSGTILEAFGERPARPAHRALDDARSIGDGLKLLAERHGYYS